MRGDTLIIRNFIKLISILALFVLGGCSEESPALSVDKNSTNYDQTPPEISQYMAEPAILVFSKTQAWRHNEGIAGADRFFADLSQEQSFGLFTTENGAVFNEPDLARFKVIVFNNVTGDTLSSSQRAAFKKWLLNGGAWIGLHGAGDDSHKSWPWYDETLIGPEFIGHPADPQFQEAKLVSINAAHPILKDIPSEWRISDEWYSFDGVPQEYGLVPLFGLNESSYSPLNEIYGDISDLRMGTTPAEHPTFWVGQIGKGRIVYSALGHGHQTYDHPIYRKILTNAFVWITDE